MGFHGRMHAMHEARMRGFGFPRSRPARRSPRDRTVTAGGAAGAVAAGGGGPTCGAPCWPCSPSGRCTATR